MNKLHRSIVVLLSIYSVAFCAGFGHANSASLPERTSPQKNSAPSLEETTWKEGDDITIYFGGNGEFQIDVYDMFSLIHGTGTWKQTGRKVHIEYRLEDLDETTVIDATVKYDDALMEGTKIETSKGKTHKRSWSAKKLLAEKPAPKTSPGPASLEGTTWIKQGSLDDVTERMYFRLNGALEVDWEGTGVHLKGTWKQSGQLVHLEYKSDDQGGFIDAAINPKNDALMEGTKTWTYKDNTGRSSWSAKKVYQMSPDELILARSRATTEAKPSAPGQTSAIQKWTEYSSAEGGFTILMPTDETSKVLKSQRLGRVEGGGSVVVHQVFAEAIHLMEFHVRYFDNPALPDCSRETHQARKLLCQTRRNDALDALRNSMVGTDGKLLGESEISLNNYPGREIKIEQPLASEIIARVYLVGQRVYDVYVSGFKSDVDSSPDIAKFLSSFQINWKNSADDNRTEKLSINPDELIRARSQAASEAGVALYKQQKWSKAEAKFREAVQLTAWSPDNHANLGLALEAQKKFDGALAEYNEAVRLAPTDVRFRFDRIRVYRAIGQAAKAESELKEILKLEPNNAGALNDLGYAMVERNEKLDEALQMIQRAVNAEPTNANYLDSLGWAYFTLKKLDEAERYLKDAAQRKPEDATIWEHLGDVYTERKNFPDAESAYEKAASVSTNAEQKEKLKTKAFVSSNFAVAPWLADPQAREAFVRDVNKASRNLGARSKLKFNGLYQTATGNFLRFYPDGTVLYAGIQPGETVDHIMTWFAKERTDVDIARGAYSFTDNRIKFVTKSKWGEWEFEGEVRDMALSLHERSGTYQAQLEFTFKPSGSNTKN